MVPVKRVFAFLFALFSAGSAWANWEYSGNSRAGDDGGRMVVALRGGMAMPFVGNMKNDLGTFEGVYYTYFDSNNDFTGYFFEPTCSGAFPSGDCPVAGAVNIGDFPLTKKYDSYSWAGGVSVGMVAAGSPALRIELDWLHIAESDFNSTPLFFGVPELGYEGSVLPVASASWPVGSARTTVSTDVISAMFYYDIFIGKIKPMHSLIPYIGAGIGYATSTTLLAFVDSFGDFSADTSMWGFGEDNGIGGIDFYTSETTAGNFAASAAFGFSYGMDEGLFFDLGIRGSFVPRIRWSLNNNGSADATNYKERAIFSAENIIFASVYAGIRFEF
jgi:hypothetical protein